MHYQKINQGFHPFRFTRVFWLKVSENLTHLAFYAGWPKAMSAVSVTKAIFENRGVTANAFPAASPPRLPLNEQAENTVQKPGRNLSALVYRGWLSLLPTRWSVRYCGRARSGQNRGKVRYFDFRRVEFGAGEGK